MPQRSRRRFSILDALVLVGACAIGLAPLRYAAGIDLFDEEQWAGYTPSESLILAISLHAGPSLMTLSLAVLAMSFRGPRGTLRNLTRRPGFVACLVVVAAAVHPILRFAINAWTTPGSAPDLIRIYDVILAADLRAMTGPMLIAAWLPMALGGRWRPAPTWVDRAGCVLGGCWIAQFLLSEGFYIVRLLSLR